MLAASYLRARRLPFVWYQLDADDADVATFVYHLGAAVRLQARRGRRRPLPLLKQEFQLGLASFARRFFRDVYSRLQPRFVVVLDDYQEVSEHAVLHDVVRLAAAELPTGSRLLILSRAHPPAALAHLRATRKIELVQWPALQLSLAEATAIARRRCSARLSARVIRALHHETDGWVAGLVLCLEGGVGGAAERRNAAPARSRQAVFDYFAGEIFRTESKRVQTVLMETAFINPMSADLAEALTGSPEARKILERLSRRNYFTERYLEHELVYRYHPLFRDFLLARAETAFPPERLVSLRRTAARLLCEHGRAQDAVDLLRDAHAWDELGALIRDEAPGLVAQGRTATLSDWLAQLPDRVVPGNAWLLYWRGLTHLTTVRRTAC